MVFERLYNLYRQIVGFFFAHSNESSKSVKPFKFVLSNTVNKYRSSKTCFHYTGNNMKTLTL